MKSIFKDPVYYTLTGKPFKMSESVCKYCNSPIPPQLFSTGRGCDDCEYDRYIDNMMCSDIDEDFGCDR